MKSEGHLSEAKEINLSEAREINLSEPREIISFLSFTDDNCDLCEIFQDEEMF